VYPTSDEYRTAIQENRVFKQEMLGNLWYEENGNRFEFPFTAKNVIPKTFSYLNQCIPDEDFIWAQVNAGKLTVSLKDIDVSQHNDKEWFINFIVRYYISDDEAYDIPFQSFDVDKITHTGKIITITAYDYMTRLDKEMKRSFLGTPYACLVSICETCGIQFALERSQVEAMPNGHEQLFLDINEMKTGRDMVRNIAKILCGYATIDRDSKLTIRQFPVLEYANRDILPRAREISKTEWGDKVSFQGFKCYFIDFQGMSNLRYTYNADDNMLMDLGEIYGVNRYIKTPDDPLTNLFNSEIAKIDYTTFSSNIVPDPTLDLGDIVVNKAMSGDDNLDKWSVVTHIEYRFKDSMIIACKGATTAQRSVRSAETRQREATQIAIEKNAFMSMAFTNADQIALTNTYQRVAFFRFGVADDCHTMMNVMFPLYSEKDGDIDVKFMVNDVEESAEVFSHQFVAGHTIVTIAQEYNFSKDDMIMIEVFAKNHYVETDDRRQNAYVESLANFARYGGWVEPVIDTTIPSAQVAPNALRAFLFGKGIESFGVWSGILFAGDDVEIVQFGGFAIENSEITCDVDLLEIVYAPTTSDVGSEIHYGTLTVPLIGGEVVTATIGYIDAITFCGEIYAGQEWLL